jgi:hypothetical protein
MNALALREVPFREDTIQMVTEQDGEVWIPLKRLCENLGVDPTRQTQKVESDPRFSYRHMSATAPDGKNYGMFCIPVSQVSAWLFSINPNKVRPDLQEKLLFYQKGSFYHIITTWYQGMQKSAPERERKLTERCLKQSDKIKEMEAALRERFPKKKQSVVTQLLISIDLKAEIRALKRWQEWAKSLISKGHDLPDIREKEARDMIACLKMMIKNQAEIKKIWGNGQLSPPLDILSLE